MENIKCKKCGGHIGLIKDADTFKLLCADPVYMGLYVTCRSCGTRQVAAVMDEEQLEAFSEYRSVIKKIERRRKGGWRPHSIVNLERKADTLRAYMQARAPKLMDAYLISQKVKERSEKRKQINGKE